MAITVIANPYNFFPAYNQMRFIVDSNNKNQPAFEYMVQVFPKGLTTPIATYAIKPRFGDGYGNIDLSKLLSSKVSSEIENAGSTAYFNSINSYYEYDVKFGERYIQSVSYISNLTNSSGKVRINATNSFTAGSQVFIQQADGGVANPQLEGYQTVISVGVGYFVVNVAFSTITNAGVDGSVRYADNRRVTNLNIASKLNNIVFNGVFNEVGINSYNPATYDLNGVNDLPLTVLPETGFVISKSAPLLVNFRTQGSSSGSIRFENSDGDLFEYALFGTQEITTINLGTFNLPTLTAITGTLPLVKPTTKWYDFYYYESGQKSRKTRVELLQSCEIEPYSILFVDKLGSIIPLPFTLKSKESMEVRKETYNREQQGTVSGSMWRNKVIEGGITAVNMSQSKKITLEAPYVNDEMSELYYQMHASPRLLLFDGTYFHPVTLDTTNVTKQRWLVDRKNRYTITVSFSNNELVNG